MTPELVGHFRGMLVVMKPRGWEVDGKGSAPNDGELLSEYVQSQLPRCQFPLVHTRELDHGFIHRLDIPSSGLILTGTTFEGLHWIRWQLNVYRIDREYSVGCQGLAPPGCERIDVAIDVRTHKLGSHRSLTGEHGGPAVTWVRPAAHACSGLGDTFTLTGVRIRTGRKHQIRTHLRSRGHPSVADGMYTVLEVGLRMLAPVEAHLLRRLRGASACSHI